MAFSADPIVLSADALNSRRAPLPRFIRIENTYAADGVCYSLHDKEKNRTEELYYYVPVLDSAQAASLAQGVDIVVNTFVRHLGCNVSAIQGSVQGVVLSSSYVEPEVRSAFKGSHVLMADEPSIIDQRYAPTSIGTNVLFMLLGTFAGICGLVPFFKRDRWPRAKELVNSNVVETLGALFPIMKVIERDDMDLVTSLKAYTAEEHKEVVLAKINCEDIAKSPSFAVFTNKRYILFRTQYQFGLRVLKLIEQ